MSAKRRFEPFGSLPADPHPGDPKSDPLRLTKHAAGLTKPLPAHCAHGPSLMATSAIRASRAEEATADVL